MNKLIIDGNEFELTTPSMQQLNTCDCIYMDGKIYFKKAIPKEKQKDYEILAFKADYGGHSDVLFEYNIATGYYVPELHQLNYGKPTWTVDDVIKNHNGKIYSVKRLSDGEVFTVGDEITGASYSDERKIQSIILSEDRICLKQHRGTTNLQFAKKIKKPIFTTADGKGIYEGDEYWFIYPQWTVGKVEKAKGDMNGALATLSTKEAAEEWVLMNKPMLSLNDLLDSWSDLNDRRCFMVAPLCLRFKNAAKNKLK